MTKEEFKEKWESNEEGGGITNEDVAKCFVEWGLGEKPYIKPINYVVWRVCESANTNDKEFWKRKVNEKDDD